MSGQNNCCCGGCCALYIGGGDEIFVVVSGYPTLSICYPFFFGGFDMQQDFSAVNGSYVGEVVKTGRSWTSTVELGATTTRLYVHSTSTPCATTVVDSHDSSNFLTVSCDADTGIVTVVFGDTVTGPCPQATFELTNGALISIG